MKSVSSPTTRRKPTKASARNKLMDLLARRDHSEKELREKLRGKFSAEEIDKAIDFAKSSRWLPDSPEALSALAEKTASGLRRRGKGIHFINRYLTDKGLPPVNLDSDEELEKARALVENKFFTSSSWDKKQKAKIGRFLLSRGFDMEIVRKVVYGK